MAMGYPSAVVLKHIVRSFGKISAVDNVELEIKPDEIFGLLGPMALAAPIVLATSIDVLRPSPAPSL